MKTKKITMRILVFAALAAISVPVFISCEKVGEQIVDSIIGSKKVKATFEAGSPRGEVAKVKAYIGNDGLNAPKELTNGDYKEKGFELLLLHPVDASLLHTVENDLIIALTALGIALLEGELELSDNAAKVGWLTSFTLCDKNGAAIDTAYCYSHNNGANFTEYSYLYTDKELTFKAKYKSEVDINLPLKNGWNIIAISEKANKMKVVENIPSNATWNFRDKYLKDSGKNAEPK